MGITEKRLVAQKVAIWDGMLVAKMQGNDIDVSIIYSLPFLEPIPRLLLIVMGLIAV